MKKLLLVSVLASALLLVPAAPALASAHTFYVHPSGGNDTHNIQNAFNAAVKAGPGSTVQLGAGQFYVNTVFVQNFRGFFRGAGEGKTVVGTYGVVPLTAEPFPFLVGFSGGNVCVSNMSFDITSMAPAASWYDMWGQGPFTALGAIVLATGSASTSFDQVGFTAAPVDQTGDDWNVSWDLAITGAQQWFTPPAVSSANNSPLALAPTGGIDSVSCCSFTGNIGVFADGLTAGSLTVGGSAARQNVFNGNVGCDARDSSNSTIVISHNLMQIYDAEGVVLYQSWYNPATPPPPLPAPRCFVSDNDISTTGAGGGVLLEDDSEWNLDTPRLDATISGNNIHLDNAGLDGGVDGFMVHGAKVLGNHIWGIGAAGIDVGADFSWGTYDEPASGWLIIGNDVSGVNATNASGGPAAQIWLGPNADHCLVVGGCKPTTVLDQGTKDTLINVTKLTDPTTPAATPMDSLKQMKQLKGMMRP